MDLRCALCLIWKESGLNGRPAITLINGTAVCNLHIHSLPAPVPAPAEPVRRPYSATG